MKETPSLLMPPPHQIQGEGGHGGVSLGKPQQWLKKKSIIHERLEVPQRGQG